MHAYQCAAKRRMNVYWPMRNSFEEESRSIFLPRRRMHRARDSRVPAVGDDGVNRPEDTFFLGQCFGALLFSALCLGFLGIQNIVRELLIITLRSLEQPEQRRVFGLHVEPAQRGFDGIGVAATCAGRGLE